MKKASTIIISLIIFVVVYTNQLWFIQGKTTVTQQKYICEQVRNTKKIIVRKPPKFGGEIIGEITNNNEIPEWISSLEIEYSLPPTAGLSELELEFIQDNGKSIKVLYKNKLNDKHLKFKNDWNIEGIPSKQLSELINKIKNN